VALSLARDDVGAALLAAPPERPAAAGLERLLPLAARLGRLIRGAPAHGVKAAWFFHDVPDASTLRALREVGVTAIRTYQVSESAALCGLAPEHASTGPSGLAGSRSDGPVPTGYRVPAGVSVQILDPSRDGVGEIAIGGPAVASEALDASRSLVALPRVEGHLPTGDVGRVDAAGRLHVLGTQTFALRSAATTLTGEQVAAHYDGGPWEAFVAVPERLLWPEEVPGSWRWVAILHGAEQAVARRFLLARGAVVPEALRVHGFVCSPAAFPLGTHGRLRREALLGALRSAFAAHGSTEAERARIIDWLPSPATAGALP
jgi:hypothetical protein